MSISIELELALFFRLPSFDGYIHNTYNLTSLMPVRSKVECASICMKNLECGSFFYLNQSTKMCQTHSVLFLTIDEAMIEANASYYQLTQDRCPHQKGYTLYRPIPLCYRYVQTNVTWVAAKGDCDATQAHLMYVKTPAISSHIVNFLRASSASRQTAVSVGAERGSNSWYWSDGSAVTWTNWGSGEPSDVNERCMALAWFYYFQWNDVPCNGSTSDLQRYYMCQLDIP